MTLTGKSLWLALAGSAAVGVLSGVSVGGWRTARGLPPLEVSVDAGVRVELDAGVKARSDCAASIEHWSTVTIPGPTRYVYLDGGVRTEVQTVTVLVPDVSLRGSSASTAVLQADGEATASAHVLVAPSAPERHWQAGPAILYGLSGHNVLWGAQAGWSGGPFDIRAQAMKAPGDVYLGLSAGWRW